MKQDGYIRSMKLRADYRAVLTNGNFLKLWGAQIISAMGAQLTTFALFALVTKGLSDREQAQTFGWLEFWKALPGALLGSFMGVMIDRWNRRRIMITLNLLRAPMVFSLWVFFWMSQTYGLPRWPLFVLLVGIGLLSTFFNATESATIPTVVGRENLLAANSLAGTTVIIATLVGTAVAGAIVQVFEKQPQWNFIVDAFGFLISALLIYGITLPYQPGLEMQRHQPVLYSLVRGFSFIRTRPKVRARVFLSVLFWFIGGALYVQVLPFADKVLALNRLLSALLISALGIGLLGGGLVVGAARVIARYDHLPYFVLFGVSLAILAFAQATNFATAFAGMMGIGFLGAWFIVPIEARLQELVPNPKRGRVFGVRGALTSIFFVSSLPTSGFLGGYFGVQLGIERLGWGLLVITLLMIFFAFEIRYHLLRLIFKALFKVLFRMKVEGLEHVPLDEPALFAPNHTSMMDPFVLGAATPVRLRFVMAQEEFEKDWFRRWALRRLGTIPIRREARSTAHTLGAVVLALREDKNNVAIYPEGRISRDGSFQDLREGPALIARKARVPIVPVWMEGVYEALPLDRRCPRFVPIRVRFGKPLRFPSDTDRHEITAKLREAMLALKEKMVETKSG